MPGDKAASHADANSEWIVANGFALEAVERRSPASMMDLPGMAGEMRRPMMLLVKAVAR